MIRRRRLGAAPTAAPLATPVAAVALAAVVAVSGCASESVEPPPSATAAAPPSIQPPPSAQPTQSELVRPLETWGGAGGAVDIQSSMRASTAEEWQALWDLVGLRPPRRLAVGREVAAGVFLGERPTGGYGIEILGLRTQAASSAVVWQERRPPQDAAVSMAVTRPWQIAVFPAEALPAGGAFSR